MLDCLEDHGPSQSMAPDVGMLVLDGAAVVLMLNPTNGRTFLDYLNILKMSFCHIFSPI